jgi:hypothetical protein
MPHLDPFFRRHLAGIAFLVLVLGLAAGCASSSTAVHPGAANATDSQIYDTLVSVQASIEQAKIDFGSDPAAKPYLNKLIVGYNGAQDAYKSYHQLAVSGHAPDPATLQAQIAALVQDIAALQAQFKKGAPK